MPLTAYMVGILNQRAARALAEAELSTWRESQLEERARVAEALRLMEEQFRQAQKMEAVGRLAGGVAHDFNNLLTVINGYSDIVLTRLPPDDPGHDQVCQIRKAGERAAGLTRQLLAFSRKQVLQPQVVDVNSLLRNLCKLLERLIGEDVDLTLSLDSGLAPARVDPGQFEQAIINLAVNARDAMPQGGSLRISTDDAQSDDDYTFGHPDSPPGRYIRIIVTDTGEGMDEATRKRIFEPFFSTKAPGQGTGLGLAMVYGFVHQSGGRVGVESELGSGTSFRVYLPCADSAHLEANQLTASSSSAAR
jgi:signal transduction histidine kinase